MIRAGSIRAAVLLGLALAAGCATVPQGPVNVPLVYRPKAVVTGVVTPIRANILLNVIDERAKQDAIGQNVEEAMPVKVITADSPATFVREIAMRQLGGRGATIVTDETKADKTIVIRLKNFWADEGGTYKAEVQLAAEILDKNGKELWRAISTGQGSTFGRSLSAENYQEVFTDATSRAVQVILSDSSVTSALNAQ